MFPVCDFNYICIRLLDIVARINDTPVFFLLFFNIFFSLPQFGSFLFICLHISHPFFCIWYFVRVSISLLKLPFCSRILLILSKFFNILILILKSWSANYTIWSICGSAYWCFFSLDHASCFLVSLHVSWYFFKYPRHCE